MSTVAAENFSGTILDVAPGSSLGHYELLVPIATGGMARVWAARRHDTPTRFVAIKMILPDLAEDQGFQTMFQDEARLGAMLHHPNVCETYEISQVKGIHYLAMEWVDGTSLLRLLRARGNDVPDDGGVVRVPIDCRVAARIVSDACLGLHAAHELTRDDGTPLGLVHRDATPHNILITADGRVKMSDFGVAKALGNSHATLAGQIKGKVSYMAPEQLCGDPLDRRADVFALGVCLYESVAGRKAFVADSDPEIMSQIILGQIDPPSAYAPGLPPGFEAVVLKAMQLAPEDRFPTALAMHEALEAFLRTSGPPVTTTDVAAVLEARCGQEIHDRRENIRIACMEPGLTGATSEPPTEIFVPISEGENEASATRRRGRPVAPWEEAPPQPSFQHAGPPSGSMTYGQPPPSAPYGYPPPPSSYGYGPPSGSQPGVNPGPATTRTGQPSYTTVVLVAAGIASLVGIVGVIIAVLLWRRSEATDPPPAPPAPAMQRR